MRVRILLVVTAALAAVVTEARGGTPGQQQPSPVTKANNQFALDLYAQLGKSEFDNLFFSPGSISIALTMTAAGARGQTEAEMAKVLCLGDQLNAAHGEYRKLLAAWNDPAEDRGYQLRMANRLWVQDGYPLVPAYVELTGGDYGAVIAPLDYVGDAEGSRAVINQWVEKQTEQKIKDLLPQGSIDALTRLVLTNAIYFKGDWAEQFDKERTRPQDFSLSAYRHPQVPMMSKQVPMMTKTARFGYTETPELQVLEMPYQGRELMVNETRTIAPGTVSRVSTPIQEHDLSMVILLPRKTDGLAALEKSLSADKLAGWLGATRRKEVNVTLPKFKLESSFNLNKTLQAMGMKLAFGAGADFSGISGRDDLYISDVVHKAYVAVDEEGTEAAAATGVVMTLKAMPEPTPTFRADHPFLFLIRDIQSGSILFLGRLADPKP